MSDFDDPPIPPPPPASPRQVLLGAFILFQLTFLIVANFLGLLKWAPGESKEKTKNLINQAVPGFASKQGHGWGWAKELEDGIITRWTQLSGHDQAWSLFAPTVATSTGFPAVLLIWDAPHPEETMLPGTMYALDDKNGIQLCATWNTPLHQEPSLPTARHLAALGSTNPWEALSVQAARLGQEAERMRRVKFLLSENEPADVNSYFRTGNCRVRRAESTVYLSLLRYYDDDKEKIEKIEDQATRATERVKGLVNDYHDATLAYMKWRLKAWEKNAGPGEPRPKQVVLFQRSYRIHGPATDKDDNVLEERGWDRPILHPVARWQPEHPHPNASGWVLEYYDYTERRFIPIR